MSSSLRQLACAAWIAVAACSGPDVSAVVDHSVMDQSSLEPGAASPGTGAVSAGSPEGVSPGAAAPGGGTPGGGTLPTGSLGGSPPESSGSNAAPGGSLPLPASMEAPGSASAEEPQPSATETNFFTARCFKDADCGETRRCEFPPDAGAERAAPPDAGAAAAPSDVPAPAGRCVAGSAN